jgi:hypothetical protein
MVKIRPLVELCAIWSVDAAALYRRTMVLRTDGTQYIVQ